MGELAGFSGAEAVKRFKQIGYQVVRQKGSHVRLRHLHDHQRKPLTIPMQRELKIGLLHQLIKDAGIEVAEFLNLLKGSL